MLARLKGNIDNNFNLSQYSEMPRNLPENPSRFYLFLRFCAQCFFRALEWFFDINDSLTRFIMFRFRKPEFIRQGSCANTGQCCRNLGILYPKFWDHIPGLVSFLKWWHGMRYNFLYLGTRENGENKEGMLVYECQYLTKENLCGIHRYKPKLCRDFPSTTLWGYPKLHKGCGYYFQHRDGTKTFDRILDEVEKSKEVV